MHLSFGIYLYSVASIFRTHNNSLLFNIIKGQLCACKSHGQNINVDKRFDVSPKWFSFADPNDKFSYLRCAC